MIVWPHHMLLAETCQNWEGDVNVDCYNSLGLDLKPNNSLFTEESQASAVFSLLRENKASVCAGWETPRAENYIYK